MKDNIAQAVRLMKVVEAIIAEIDRQGAATALADLRFAVTRLAQAVINAADRDVIPFPPSK